MIFDGIDSVDRIDGGDVMKPTSNEIVVCARACELSYAVFDDGFRAKLNDLGFNQVETIERAGVEAFCAVNDEHVLICFRGTDSSADWLADASASKTKDKEWMVHTGFLRTLLIVEESVLASLWKCFERGKRVLVTGHSLGGAMAVLFASRLKVSDVVVTFGCPRVGDKTFSRVFNWMYKDRSLRFVNNNDAVTRVPFKFMGFSHVWRQQYFDRKGKLHVDYRPGRFWKFFDALAGRLRSLARVKFGDGIRDHSMKDYLRLVERNVDLL